MTHAPAHSAALDAACQEWQALFGADAVLRAPDVLRRCGRTTLPDAPGPAGDSYWQLVRRLKRRLDPGGILAAGRYLLPEADG